MKRGSRVFHDGIVGMARKAAEAGFTNDEIAQLFGVNTCTILDWCKRFPAFREALRLGKQGPDDRVEAALFKRAVGFHYDSEKIFIVDGEVVRVPFREYVIPDSHAATRWLVNRRPEVWRDRRSLDMTVREERDLSKLTDAELEALAQGALDDLPTDDLQRLYASTLTAEAPKH
jgi:hypothetical protein